MFHTIDDDKHLPFTRFGEYSEYLTIVECDFNMNFMVICFLSKTFKRDQNLLEIPLWEFYWLAKSQNISIWGNFSIYQPVRHALSDLIPVVYLSCTLIDVYRTYFGRCGMGWTTRPFLSNIHYDLVPCIGTIQFLWFFSVIREWNYDVQRKNSSYNRRFGWYWLCDSWMSSPKWYIGKFFSNRRILHRMVTVLCFTIWTIIP